jgi:BolA family transcriptional regulator, general stress-responsive regulator
MADGVTERVEATLRQALSPERLEVHDDSHRHHGHAGSVPGKTTHLRIVVVAEAMRGLSRVERHRRMNALLAPEIALGLHALQIEAKAPGE